MGSWWIWWLFSTWLGCIRLIDFVKNHISYGIHLDEIIKNKKSILNKLNLQKEHKIYPIGSALRFDYFIKKKKEK